MGHQSNSISYQGRNIFVGIDVHKKNYVVVARVDGETIKKWTTSASPEKFAEQLIKYFGTGKIETAYEAGFSGFALHRELEKHGIHNRVVHAAGIEVAVNDRVKTDKRDAHKLSALLEVGRIRGIRIPSEEEENNRQLTRTRQQLVEDRAAIKNKIRMKFHQQGFIEPEETRHMSHQLVRDLLKQNVSQEFLISINAYWSVWRKFDEEISKIEKELTKQAKRDTNETIYLSAPGVGPLSSRVLSNELGNMSQFNNERQLFSYTGLTPSEHSSGDNIRRGHISRQGNNRVRRVLVEVAWRAITKDKSLEAFFNKLYPKVGKKKAIVAVARKLIGRIRAAFRNGEKYNIEHPNPSSIAV